MLSRFSGHRKVFGKVGEFFGSESDSSRSFWMSLSMCSISKTYANKRKKNCRWKMVVTTSLSLCLSGCCNGCNCCNYGGPSATKTENSHDFHFLHKTLSPIPAAKVHVPRRDVLPYKGLQQCWGSQTWWLHPRELGTRNDKKWEGWRSSGGEKRQGWKDPKN